MINDVLKKIKNKKAWKKTSNNPKKILSDWNLKGFQKAS